MIRPLALASLMALLCACASIPRVHAPGLQRSLFPGLASLDEAGIAQALETRVALDPPLSAGIAWLGEALPGSPEQAASRPLLEYGRTGVLEAASDALAGDPFARLVTLPTVPKLSGAAPDARTLDALRSAAAHFQLDVALLLQTGTAEDRGVNPLALGYLGLVTAPLFPGSDIAAASSAELCAVDVRSGVMLGCARGRGRGTDRVLFLWQVDGARRRLVERTLRESVVDAADALRGQLAARLATLSPVSRGFSRP